MKYKIGQVVEYDPEGCHEASRWYLPGEMSFHGIITGIKTANYYVGHDMPFWYIIDGKIFVPENQILKVIE